MKICTREVSLCVRNPFSKCLLKLHLRCMHDPDEQSLLQGLHVSAGRQVTNRTINKDEIRGGKRC